MAKKRETRRQLNIRKEFKKRYGNNLWCFKVHGGPFQRDGIGDIIGVVFGLAFMFEVKEPDGTASPIQLETIKDFRAAGGIAEVIVEVDEAFKLIDRALARARGGSPLCPWAK